MLGDESVLGTETFCMKIYFTRESPGNQGVARQQEKDLEDYGCGLQKLTDFGMSPFISGDPEGTS